MARNLSGLSKKSIKYGGESREKVQRVPFASADDTARERLVGSLAAAIDDVDRALAVVDALDAYLQEGPDRTVRGLEDLTPNYAREVQELRAELEERSADEEAPEPVQPASPPDADVTRAALDALRVELDEAIARATRAEEKLHATSSNEPRAVGLEEQVMQWIHLLQNILR